MPDQSTSSYTIQLGDTLHSLAQLYYRDRNKWIKIQQTNPLLGIFGADQPLPAGLQLTLPFIPELTTTILTEEGDTLGALATFFYFSESQWTTIQQANSTLQGFGPDQPLPAGLQLTLPFIPERTIILVTNEGDTLGTFAQTFYNDKNQWVRFPEVNTILYGIDRDQPLPAGLRLTLPFIPELTTAIRTEEGDTLRALATSFYGIDIQWPRIRQANSTLQGIDPSQGLPAGLQLTLPSLIPTRIIITEEGDTFRALAQTYAHTEDQWIRFRQLNPALQGFGPDEPLPIGYQLALTFFVEITFRTVITSSNDTFMSLAQTYYNNASKWPIIRQANPPFQKYNGNQILPAGISLTVP